MSAAGIVILLLVDLACFLAGVMITTGRFRNKISQLRHKPLELRCQCGHLFTSHRAGHCKEPIRREHYDRDGDRSGWQWRDCPCNGYLGPDPSLLGLWRPVEEKEKGSLTRYGAQVDPYLD